MRWWAWIWLAATVALTIGGASDDCEEGRGPVATALGIAAGLVCALSIVAFSLPLVGQSLGKWLVPLAGLSGMQIALEALRDWWRIEPDPELSIREQYGVKVFAVLAVGIVFGPAVVVGITTGLRQW